MTRAHRRLAAAALMLVASVATQGAAHDADAVAAFRPADDTDPWIPGDVGAPTVPDVHDEPVLRDLVIQKVITGVPGAGDDLSGFNFTVTRADIYSRDSSVVTDSSGRTPPLPVPAGEYVITEVGRPDWWPPDQPLPSSVIATVGIDDADTITFSFDNQLPAPTIVTSATDAADGDKYLARSGGTIVDDVRMCGLVPGTRYTISGRLVFVSDDGTAEATEIVAIGDIAATTDGARCVTTTLSFDIPTGSAYLGKRGRFVVTEEVLVGDVVVARHDDPDSTEQSVHLADIDAPPTPPDPTSPETTTTTPTAPVPAPTVTPTTTITPTTTAPPTTAPPPTTTTPTTTTTTTTPPPTGPPTTTTTTTTTSPLPTTAPPETTPPETTPPTSTPPSAALPAAAPPGEPNLPRTGGEAWRTWYRVGSLILLLGATLFFASTLGIDAPAEPRTRSRRASSRLPGTGATRTARDER